MISINVFLGYAVSKNWGSSGMLKLQENFKEKISLIIQWIKVVKMIIKVKII